VLEEWYNFVNEFHPIRCDAIVYLKTSPEVAFARVQERAREEESKLDLAYLKQLHDRHEELLNNQHHPLDVPIITINADKNLDEIQEEFQRCYTEIKAQYNREKEKPWREAIIKV
jgi:deoxynucleoside kinase